MIIYWTTVFIVKLVAMICYRHKVYGKANFPKGGGIISSNHSSFLDPPLIGISCPTMIHFLGRETLFRYPLFNWLIRQLNTHPVHQGKGNIDSLRKTIELVKSGKKVVIFPEGHRSAGGEFQKGQMGVGMLVQRTECQVIPIYTHGAFEVWSSKRRFPKLWGKTACVIGTPLTFSTVHTEEKKEARQEIVDAIMNKIIELKEWYLAGAKGTPP